MAYFCRLGTTWKWLSRWPLGVTHYTLTPLALMAPATLTHNRHSSRAAERMLKLGIGPDGAPLPQPNKKRLHPRMYPVLVVNQDGSTYTIRHRSPLQILVLPLDPATLSPEEREERERVKRAARERVYVEEDMEEDDSWDQDQYRDLIDR